MSIIEIRSLSDPFPGLFYHLTDAQLRSRQEPEKGIFIAEGPKVVKTALSTGLEPLSVLIRRKFIDGAGKEILDLLGDVPIYTADDSILSEITGFRLQRSWILCAFRRPPLKSAEALLQNARRVAVLEGITEPSNIGAIFRSAAALSIDAILLSDTCCDPYHRRAVRVCMGSLFTIPFARPGSSLFPLLKQYGFFCAGMALRDPCLSIDDPSLSSKERLAIFLGTEDTGLSEETLQLCDAVVRIPMAPGIDSLNVAAAGAIAFWQLRPRTDDN